MSRKRCPRCGGHIDVEVESRSRSGGSVRRSIRCTSRGAFRGAGASRGGGAGPWSTRGEWRGRFPALFWVVAAALVLWVALKLLPYADRAEFYRAVAGGLEGFLNPLWALGLAVGAVALLLGWAVCRRRPTHGEPKLAPDVHLRTEPEGSFTIVISDSRSALVRDFVVVRRPQEERRILARFGDLAARSVAVSKAGSQGAEQAPGREEIDEAQRELYSLGLSLGDALLGSAPEARDRLLDLPGDHLLLRMQPELCRFPWELLVPRAGGQFLWQRFSLSRQLRDDLESAPAKRSAGSPARMLLIANLEAGRRGRELRWAEAEASELLDVSAREPHLLRVVRRSPRTSDELKELLAQGFDIVHFAGHTDDDADGGRWVMADGEAVNPADLLRDDSCCPMLVFANACGSGPAGGRPGTGGGDAALSMLRRGIAAYVGTLWELHDAGSAGFARIFYRALLAGSTVAAAANAARAGLLGSRLFTWANYVVYGDPTLALSAAFFGPKKPRSLND